MADDAFGGEPQPSRNRTGGTPHNSVHPANAQGRVVIDGSARPPEADLDARLLAEARRARQEMGWMGEVDAAVRRFANTVTFGGADQFAAGMDALTGSGEGNSIGERYRYNQRVQNAINQADEEVNSGGVAAGDAAGVVYENFTPSGRAGRLVRRGEQVRRAAPAARRGRNRREDTRRGEPVAVVRGEYVETFGEFFLDGTIPLDARRTYGHLRGTDGPLGPDRTTLFDVTVEVMADNGLLYRDEDGREIEFDRPFDHQASRNVEFRHLSLTAPWLKRLELADGSTVRHFRQDRDKVYRLVAITDGNSNRIDFSRDDEGMLTRAEHSDGYALAFENDGDRRASVTLEMGGATRRLVGYAYDADRRLSEAACSDAFTIAYEYDAEGRLAQWRDRTGRSVTRIDYDATGRVAGTRTTGPSDGDRFAYDPGARTTEYRPGGGEAVERFVYDENDDVVVETDAEGGETRHAYVDGYRTQTTDPLGHTVTFAYDADGNVAETADAEGRRVLLRWDGPGRLALALRSGTGKAWRWSHDEHGNVVRAEDPFGAVTTFEWTPAGRLAAVHRPDGRTERREYDAAHRLVRIVDAAGGVTRYERDDPFGRVTAATDPTGATTRYAYDEAEGVPFHTPTRLTRPDGVTVDRRFDGEGMVAEVTDGEGRTTRYGYGAYDLLASITDPRGGVLSLAYDVRGKLERVTNANGQAYTYERDAAGRVVAETDFDGRTLRYVRDAAGHLIRRDNADGSCVVFERDRSGLILERRGYAPGVDPVMGVAEVTERFAYDAAGLPVRGEGPDGVVRFERDRVGRVVREEVAGRVVTSTFDPLGRRVERTAGGALAQLAYDPLGALTELTLGEETISFTRDAVGREVGRQSGAFALTQAFDAVGQLTRQHGTGVERGFRWNAAFEVDRIDDSRWGGTAYDYDDNGQVTEARHGLGLAPRPQLALGVLGLAGDDVEVERFAYDPARDVEASDAALPGAPLGAPLTPWLTSAGGKVRAARGPAGERILLTHDVQGRIVERRVERAGFRPRTWRYTWNALDRLVACETPDGERWRYGYDPFGRRLWKRRVDAAEGRSGEVYAWDGDVVAEVAPLYADGRIAWDEAVAWHYDPVSFRPLARRDNGRLLHVVADHLDTPRELVDGTGNVVWARAHRLWGSPRGLRADNDDGDLCPIGFAGQWRDGECGLSYNRFRWYDAEVGQYASPDPIGLDGGVRPQGYAPAPTSGIDPYGLNSYITYLGTDAATGRPYVGYASSPTSGARGVDVLNYRYSGDYSRFGGTAPEILYSGPDRNVARGLEQRTFEQLGGLDGTANRQNPVGPNNPNRDTYLNSADRHLEQNPELRDRINGRKCG